MITDEKSRLIDLMNELLIMDEHLKVQKRILENKEKMIIQQQEILEEAWFALPNILCCCELFKIKCNHKKVKTTTRKKK